MFTKFLFLETWKWVVLAIFAVYLLVATSTSQPKSRIGKILTAPAHSKGLLPVLLFTVLIAGPLNEMEWVLFLLIAMLAVIFISGEPPQDRKEK